MIPAIFLSNSYVPGTVLGTSHIMGSQGIHLGKRRNPRKCKKGGSRELPQGT